MDNLTVRKKRLGQVRVRVRVYVMIRYEPIALSKEGTKLVAGRMLLLLLLAICVVLIAMTRSSSFPLSISWLL